MSDEPTGPPRPLPPPRRVGAQRPHRHRGSWPTRRATCLTERGHAQARAAGEALAGSTSASPASSPARCGAPARPRRRSSEPLGLERRDRPDAHELGAPGRASRHALGRVRRAAGASSRRGRPRSCRCSSPTASSPASSSSTRCSASGLRRRRSAARIWHLGSANCGAHHLRPRPDPLSRPASRSPAGPASAGWSGRGIAP